MRAADCAEVGMATPETSRRIRELGRHDHVCWIYGSDEEHRAGLVEYVDAGLRLGERVMVASASAHRSADNGLPVTTALGRAGVPVEAARATGQLVLTSAEQEYAGHGGFDPDGRLDRFAAYVRAAVAE